MRVGLVMNMTYNFGTFYGNPCAQGWLGALLDYIGNGSSNGTGRDWRPTVAYISAANEINNIHSSPDLFYMTSAGFKDTFDTWKPDDFSINEFDILTGIHQMHTVDDIVKAHSQILTTISLGTDNVGTDWVPTTADYIKCSNVPPASPCQDGVMGQYMDFATPHNYGNGAFGVYLTMREWGFGYTNPIVLEEYGWPTDPLNQGAFYREGASNDLCPTFGHSAFNGTEIISCQIKALRERDYAGAVAFMVADINARTCNDTHSLDLFTGLFATTGNYNCGGGTVTTGNLQRKATGFVVKTYNVNP